MTNNGSSKVFAKWSKLTKKILLGDGNEQIILDLGAAELPAGRMIAFLGPSGCGKTTLLSILGLIDSDWNGDLELSLSDKRWNLGTMTPQERRSQAIQMRRRIGFIFQDIRLRSDLNALQNIIDPLTYIGLSNRLHRPLYAASLLGQLGLESPHIHRRVSLLSGGMQQRVAIARALATQPEIICADEPTANLDTERANEIYSTLRDISESKNISVIVVTHDRERANKFAHVVIEITPRDVSKDVSEENGWPFHATVKNPEVLPENNSKPSKISTRVLEDPGHQSEDSVRPTDSKEHKHWTKSTSTSDDVIERTQPSPELSLIHTRMSDVLWEALGEFRHLVQFLLVQPLRRMIRLLRTPSGPMVPGPPSHLYLPPLVAFITFLLMSVVGVLFYNVKVGITRYLDGQIQSLSALRRIRIESPASPNATGVRLPLEEFNTFISKKGVKLSAIIPRLDLKGWAMTPDRDLELLAKENTWSPEILATMQEIEGVSGTPATGHRERKNRLTANLVGGGLNDPSMQDLGISIGQTALPDEEQPDALPWIVITDDKVEWLHLGSFPSVPAEGDKLSFAFRAGLPTLGSTESLDAAGHNEQLCLQFRVAGHLQPREVHGLQLQNLDVIVHGVIQQKAFSKILAWRADPVGAWNQIPKAWLCNGQHPLAQLRYPSNIEGSRPYPTRYDVYASSPRDVVPLLKIIEEFGTNNGIIWTDLISEVELIKHSVGIIESVGWVGMCLTLVPLCMAIIVLGLVIYSMFHRRRDQLILVMIMGATPRQIQIQSLIIATIFVVPSLIAGFFIGRWLTHTAADHFDQLPTELLDCLRQGSMSVTDVGILGLAALLGAWVVAYLAVRSILLVNPADAFRGNA